MIADSGLTHVRTVWYTGGRPEPQFYYLWVKQAPARPCRSTTTPSR